MFPLAKGVAERNFFLLATKQALQAAASENGLCGFTLGPGTARGTCEGHSTWRCLTATIGMESILPEQ